MKPFFKLTVIGVFMLGLFALPPITRAYAKVHMPEILDLKVGTGAQAEPYTKVKVHYTGWLMDGTKFDSSLDRGKPIEFTLGSQRVIPGWELGLLGMKVGGRRQLIIPPELAYGKKGAGTVIPPNATLKFEVELLGVEGPAFTNISNDKLKELLADNVKIVDIRTAPEWQETGIIEGSKTIVSFQRDGRLNPNFMADFKKVAGKNDPVILICRTGHRSAVLSNALATMEGYTNIYSVTKGISSWIKDGNPVVKP